MAFILAATGAAVGLGNIWKFPYMAGMNGGGAFVLVYIVSVLAIGLPIMIAEVMLGRRGRRNPISTMRLLSEEETGHRAWQFIGWSGVTAGLLILSFYSVIAGWALGYVVRAASGAFAGADVHKVGQIYADFMADPERQLAWHTVFMGMTIWVVARGVQEGLERAVKYLMPALFLLLLVMVFFAMSTRGFGQAWNFLFHADFHRLTGTAVLMAMGHAFFTLSLGMGAMMAYGAYLPDRVSIVRTSVIVVIADTVVALLAGLAIFPVVFANGLAPDVGPGLIFQTLPLAFGQMPGGSLFGVAFFILLVFAAWTSSISLIEPAVAWLVETRGKTRSGASWTVGILVWLLGIFSILSFNHLADFKVFGRTIFRNLDFVATNIMLPLDGFLIAVFAGWLMCKGSQAHELDEQAGTLFTIWRFLVRYVAPVAVLLVFLHATGLLDRVLH